MDRFRTEYEKLLRAVRKSHGARARGTRGWGWGGDTECVAHRIIGICLLVNFLNLIYSNGKLIMQTNAHVCAQDYVRRPPES